MDKILDRPAGHSNDDHPQLVSGMDDTLDNTLSNIGYLNSLAEQNAIGQSPSNQIEGGQSSAQEAVVSKDTPSFGRILASAVLLFGVIGFSAVGGYLVGQPGAIGHIEQAALSVGVPAASINSFVDTEITQPVTPKPVAVADAQVIALVRQKAIDEKLGEMRAELLRLHALYVRLAKWTQLSDGEFDLESPLLEWKDQSSLQKMRLLNRRLAHMSSSSESLDSIVAQRHIAYRQSISGKPIVEGSRTSGFGDRIDPITGEKVEHRGLDFSGPVGEPILALADGIVSFSGKNAGYGNLVQIQHVDGLETRYAHNHANMVNRGDRVQKGQIIATLGSTGRSTGPHVHIEVRQNGTPVDPALFIR